MSMELANTFFNLLAIFGIVWVALKAWKVLFGFGVNREGEVVGTSPGGKLFVRLSNRTFGAVKAGFKSVFSAAKDVFSSEGGGEPEVLGVTARTEEEKNAAIRREVKKAQKANKTEAPAS